VRILALDTATENCSAALLNGGRLVARERQLPRGHAAHILPMIEEVLGESGVPLSALTAIAFGRGPGAFTGVRLAASVTQGLAYAAGLKVVAVSDLRAVAQRLLALSPGARRVVVLNDARMHEVYWGCFERAENDLATPVGEEQVGTPESVRLPDAWIRHSAEISVWAVGTGLAAYPELKLGLTGALAGLREDLLPCAADIARLAVPEVLSGRQLPPEQALPVYLRDDVARPAGGESLN
jgi:tRNA threonylcarbamoyladenosine biosynthesis protein TsaB